MAKEVLPEFWERDAANEAKKRQRAEELNEKALARKEERIPELDPEYSIDSPMAGQMGSSFFFKPTPAAPANMGHMPPAPAVVARDLRKRYRDLEAGGSRSTSRSRRRRASASSARTAPARPRR